MKQKLFSLFILIISFFSCIYSQITVTSPNGGECWLSGTTRTITWTAQGLWFVNIYYSTNEGNSWITIASNIQNSGSYSWQLPQNICSKTCRVKVADILNPNAFDISNNNFSILTSLSSPNLSHSVEIPPTTVLFSWNRINCADNYRFQHSINSGFTSPTEYNTSNTSIRIQNLTPGTHYFRVRAENCATFSSWSNVVAINIVQPPQPPTLISPSNNATNVSIRPTFSWNASSTATSYKIQISTNNNFTNIVRERDISTTTYQIDIDLSYNTTYYWRVNASNSGGASPWSTVFSFITMLSPPNPLSPANGAINVPINTTLTWSQTPGATNYNVQLANNSQFNPPSINQTGIPTTSLQLSNLSYSTTYYWRISASNSNGTSNWSTVFNFTTENAPPPPVPVLNSPANNSYFRINQNINFSWSSSTGANSYQIQISENPDFNNTLVNENRNSNNYNFQLNENLQMKRLYWKVRAGNNNSWSGWSAPWSVITLDKYEPNDNLVDPNSLPTISNSINQDVNVSINATIYPGSPQDMDFYRVIYPYSNNMNNIYLTLDNLPANYNLYLIVNPNLYHPLNFKSENSGTSPEIINVSIPKGYGGIWDDFFLIYVSGFGNSNPTSPYRLQVRISRGTTVSVDSKPTELPSEFKLLNNYPNPFNPTTTIEYHLPKSCFVTLTVYNSLGVKIKTLVNEVKSAGVHRINFADEKNDLPSGIYFYQLQAENFTETKKMILIR